MCVFPSGKVDFLLVVNIVDDWITDFWIVDACVCLPVSLSSVVGSDWFVGSLVVCLLFSRSSVVRSGLPVDAFVDFLLTVLCLIGDNDE